MNAEIIIGLALMGVGAAVVAFLRTPAELRYKQPEPMKEAGAEYAEQYSRTERVRFILIGLALNGSLFLLWKFWATSVGRLRQYVPMLRALGHKRRHHPLSRPLRRHPAAVGAGCRRPYQSSGAQDPARCAGSLSRREGIPPHANQARAHRPPRGMGACIGSVALRSNCSLGCSSSRRAQIRFRRKEFRLLPVRRKGGSQRWATARY